MYQSFVLLTGATGMVGFRVLTLALQAGYRVRTAVRNQAGFDKIKSLAPVAPYADRLESIIVPDITVPGAYDEAVKGVEYIIHVASPLALPKITEYENELIKPAHQGTIGILQSAHRTSGVKKIIITASVGSIIPANHIIEQSDGTVFTGENRTPTPTGPYCNVLEAYMASKVITLEATETFIKEQKPSFDVISIGPGYIVGRDDTVTDPSNITKGTNGLAIGQLFGNPSANPMGSVIAHLDDVAKVHVESLKPSIKGNQFFLITTEGPDGPMWDSALAIAKKQYPKEVADGTFKVDAGTKTNLVRSDSSDTEQAFGFKLKTYEEAVVSVVDHYLELIGRK